MTIPNIETAKIITLSTAHLHPASRAAIEAARGDIPEGPSIAIREEGFLVNSHLGMPNALEYDYTEGNMAWMAIRFPDLTTVRALARGLRAEWINFDVDGVEYSDILPTYDDNGNAELPSDPHWRELFEASRCGTAALGLSRQLLEQLEAGQTPRAHESSPEPA